VTEDAGVRGDGSAWSTSCAWFDYDRDGDLDLFVCNYLEWTKEADLAVHCTLDGTTRAYCRPDVFKGTFPYLYRNDGDGRFTDVSAEAGVQITNRHTGAKLAKSLGVVPLDADLDGWLDLVVANDTVQNFLFLNQRDGTFREVGATNGIAFDNDGKARGAMGIDAANFRNDDTQGVVIGNFSNEPTALYVSSGALPFFKDGANATGIGPPSRVMLKFGIFFFDYDLDGRLDIFTANGHLEDDIAKVQKSQRYEQPPHLFYNFGASGSTEFALVPSEICGDDFFKPLVGRGASYADIDGDGDLDILITATKGPPRLLRNDQNLGHHWLRVTLVGRTCNASAIGSLVEAHAGDVVQRRMVNPSRSYMSQVELPITFGLGGASRVDQLIVHWPDGTTQVLEDVAADQALLIEQGT
jgi:hypothetical protein